MQLTRQAAVAGTFYPGVRNRLETDLAAYLDEARVRVPRHRVAPKAIVAPHAGYMYSGPVAASAYALLDPLREKIRRVVLLGPSHRVALRGLATTSAAVFETPLGEVRVDRAACEAALALPQVSVMDEAHALEHSLEVHLPFLQYQLDDFVLAPFSVGEVLADDVAAVLEALWGDDETLIVVSSDLSHYYDYATARRRDAATTRSIEALDPGGLDGDSACGRNCLGGLLVSARRRNLEVETIDVRNSGDTAGSRDQVVGYGAWVFRESQWQSEFDELLLEVARSSVASRCTPDVDPNDYPEPLREIRSTFVTLHLDGELRGCIGSLEADLPLVLDVARSAFRAAFEDPRFSPVTTEEGERLEIQISVLSPAEPMRLASEADLYAQLRPGIDGLVLAEGDRRATFLPAVWDSLPEPTDFVTRLKEKAGLAAGHWSSRMQVSRYTTRSIS